MAQTNIFKTRLADRPAGSSSGTQNTGHDIMAGLGESVNGLAVGCNLTATVWDGSSSSLGGLFVTKGQLEVGTTWQQLLGYNLLDPDVVVGYKDGDLWISIVGISGSDGLVHFITTQPTCDELHHMSLTGASDCSFGTVYGATGSTGTTYGSFSSTGRQCGNPNIDANSEGKIAIVWQESVSYTFVFHVDAPVGPYPSSMVSPGFDFPVTTGKSNIFALHGYINGQKSDGSGGSFCTAPVPDNVLSCSGKINLGDGVSTATGINYFNVTAQAGEFQSHGDENKTYNPDVAIGQGDNPYVSYSYMNNGQLNVYQHHWGVCPDNGSDFLYDGFTNFYGGRPRIASKPTSVVANQKDFVVVGGSKSTSACPDFFPSGIISGVWKNGSSIQSAAVTLNNPNDLRNVWNTDPVVSYYLDQDGDTYKSFAYDGIQEDEDLANSWLVAWTVTDATITGGSLEGDKDDIIARHYKVDGTPLDGHNKYSFVNENKSTGGMTKNQNIPSIASRYGNGKTGYAFNDENINKAITKVSWGEHPGAAALEHDGRGECVDCYGHTGGEEGKSLKPNQINIYPNPGQGSFGIKLTPSDKSEQAVIIVTDAKGNVLLKQEWNKSQGEPKVVLKDLPAGLYNVQFTTPDGVSRRSLYNNQK